MLTSRIEKRVLLKLGECERGPSASRALHEKRKIPGPEPQGRLKDLSKPRRPRSSWDSIALRDRDYPYLSAIGIVGVAFFVRLGLDPWLNERSPFLAFTVAIIIVAGRYGIRPGLIAVTLSVMLATVFFLAPENPLNLTADQITNLGLFLLASAAMLVFAAHLKASNERAIELQAQLQKAQTETAMGAMATILAHEINQPLAAASNYLAACRRLGNDPDRAPTAKVVKAIGEAEAQIHRAAEIIRHARQMIVSKAAQRQPVSLRALVDKIIESLKVGGACENARLRASITRDADDVVVNATQIEQVLMNLLRNACQATNQKSPSEIHVSGTLNDGHTLVEVRDQGPGIDDERLRTLFTSNSVSTSGGLGLGLSICRTIVEANGGKIWAANNPGGGASFFFTLPRDRHEN